MKELDYHKHVLLNKIKNRKNKFQIYDKRLVVVVVPEEVSKGN